MKLNIFDKIFKTKDWYAANKESESIEHEYSLGFSVFCKNDKLPQRAIKKLEYICNNKDRIIEIDICENYKNIQKKYKLGLDYYLNEKHLLVNSLSIEDKKNILTCIDYIKKLQKTITQYQFIEKNFLGGLALFLNKKNREKEVSYDFYTFVNANQLEIIKYNEYPNQLNEIRNKYPNAYRYYVLNCDCQFSNVESYDKVFNQEQKIVEYEKYYVSVKNLIMHRPYGKLACKFLNIDIENFEEIGNLHRIYGSVEDIRRVLPLCAKMVKGYYEKYRKIQVPKVVENEDFDAIIDYYSHIKFSEFTEYQKYKIGRGYFSFCLFSDNVLKLFGLENEDRTIFNPNKIEKIKKFNNYVLKNQLWSEGTYEKEEIYYESCFRPQKRIVKCNKNLWWHKDNWNFSQSYENSLIKNTNTNYRTNLYLKEFYKLRNIYEELSSYSNISIIKYASKVINLNQDVIGDKFLLTMDDVVCVAKDYFSSLSVFSVLEQYNEDLEFREKFDGYLREYAENYFITQFKMQNLEAWQEFYNLQVSKAPKFKDKKASDKYWNEYFYNIAEDVLDKQKVKEEEKAIILKAQKIKENNIKGFKYFYSEWVNIDLALAKDIVENENEIISRQKYEDELIKNKNRVEYLKKEYPKGFNYYCESIGNKFFDTDFDRNKYIVEHENLIKNKDSEIKEKRKRKILEILKENNIDCFYHFTDERNLSSIKSKGGLYSWYYCDLNNINIPKPGGNDKSRSLDSRYGLQNYVRLSFCSDLPMANRLQQQGYNLVLLKVNIDVATFDDTLFSDMNATDNNHSCGGEIEDLLNVNFRATKKRYVSKTDKDFKYHQAEVLIKKKIDLKYIINIDDPIYL